MPEDNFSQWETSFVQPHINDFIWLKQMFMIAGYLQIEALKQLMAASMACFFRAKTVEDVR